ncbi:hypothetical protein LMH87_006593 [Akanthomyces muscarius]|uniref:Uncharacterized protein n=1 Tax=Akanthomyces muscarius TaxID=2231603 RepID=A0A9W8QP58_AKAMU|nr:hypothetical protein LMH87_006593 [Akanthomyces muscarius]KAJ4164940.1 hypothetical protein LMH87_006593 [Akanthomyces muscarius]
MLSHCFQTRDALLAIRRELGLPLSLSSFPAEPNSKLQSSHPRANNKHTPSNLVGLISPKTTPYGYRLQDPASGPPAFRFILQPIHTEYNLRASSYSLPSTWLTYRPPNKRRLHAIFSAAAAAAAAAVPSAVPSNTPPLIDVVTNCRPLPLSVTHAPAHRNGSLALPPLPPI